MRGAVVTIAFILLVGIAVIYFGTVTVLDNGSEQQQRELENHEESVRSIVSLSDKIDNTAQTGRVSSVTLPTQLRGKVGLLSSQVATNRITSTVSFNPREQALSIDKNRFGNFSVNSTSVSYNSSYRYYSTPPEILYENQLVFQRQSNQTAFSTDPDGLIDGRTISYVSVVSNTLRIKSPNPQLTLVANREYETTRLENVSNGPVTVSLKTRIPEQTWRDALNDEYGENGYIQTITYKNRSGENLLRLELQKGEQYIFRRGIVSILYSRNSTGTQTIKTGDIPIVNPQNVSTVGTRDTNDTASTLVGSVETLGTSKNVTVYFRYRQDGATNWQQTTEEVIESEKQFNYSLSGLSENTTYEFQTVGNGSSGENNTGVIKLFNTTGDVLVDTEEESDVRTTSATLNGFLPSIGGADTADIFFRYRENNTSTWINTSTQTLNDKSQYNRELTGLSSNTRYGFRAVANASDGENDTGLIRKFTTVADAVIIENRGADNVNKTGARLNGELLQLGNASTVDVYFRYRQTGTSDWSVTLNQTLSDTQIYNQKVSGLQGDTEYDFMSVANASDGDNNTTQIKTFKTVADEVLVENDGATQVTESSAVLNGNLTQVGANSSDVFFRYRENTSSKWINTQNQTLPDPQTFDERLSDLSIGTEYEFKAVANSSDGDNNVSIIKYFMTQQRPKVTVDNSGTVLRDAKNGRPTNWKVDVDFTATDVEKNLDAYQIYVYASSARETKYNSVSSSVSGNVSLVETIDLGLSKKGNPSDSDGDGNYDVYIDVTASDTTGLRDTEPREVTTTGTVEPGNVAYGGDDDTVYIQDTDEQTVSQTLSLSNNIEVVRWNPNGTKLAVGTSGGYIFVYNRSDWTADSRLDQQPTGRIEDIAWSSDGDELAYGGNGENVVYVYNITSDNLTNQLTQASDGIRGIEFNPNGTKLAYGSVDDTVYIHNTSDYSLNTSLVQSQKNVISVSWRPNNEQIAYGGKDNNVYVHDVSDYSLNNTLNESTGTVQSITWSSSGDRIGYGSSDTNVYIHYSQNFSIAQTLSESTDTVYSLRWSPSNTELGYASKDNTVYIHRTSDYSVKTTLTSSSGSINSLSYREDDN